MPFGPRPLSFSARRRPGISFELKHLLKVCFFKKEYVGISWQDVGTDGIINFLIFRLLCLFEVAGNGSLELHVRGWRQHNELLMIKQHVQCLHQIYCYSMMQKKDIKNFESPGIGGPRILPASATSPTGPGRRSTRECRETSGDSERGVFCVAFFLKFHLILCFLALYINN